MGKVKFEISAGGVIYKKNGNEVEVALIGLKNGKVWALPKGHIEEGESVEEAARREVAEETGLRGKVIDKIDKIEYWYRWPDENGEKVTHHKIVYFYLMEYEEGSTEDHDWEVEEVRWFPIDEAIRTATYKNERRILEKAKEMIEKHETS